ncbi:MAG TPA: PaaI family thioesterase [Burkholderiales bacterium]|nr:PaaI family thioesterase [Burkholderiales bacterium]
MSSLTDIPDGFQLDQRIQPHTFGGLVGPFYSRRQGNDLSLGLRIEGRHCNSRGTCHGGLLATLADVALGYACALAGDPDGGKRSFVTVDLSLQYLASTHLGDWVQSEVRVLSPGSRTASAAGHLLANGKPVVRISANFRATAARSPETESASGK